MYMCVCLRERESERGKDTILKCVPLLVGSKQYLSGCGEGGGS